MHEGDERLDARRLRAREPLVELGNLPWDVQRVPADGQARVLDAERLESLLAEHVGLLVGDPDLDAGRRRGHGRAGRGGHGGRGDDEGGERDEARDRAGHRGQPPVRTVSSSLYGGAQQHKSLIGTLPVLMSRCTAPGGMRTHSPARTSRDSSPTRRVPLPD